MDFGSILVFIPLAIYCFYFFRKLNQNIYLIFGTLSWCAAIYSGKHNVYQFLQEPLKSMVNMITTFFLLLIFLPYFKKSINEYKE